MRHPGLAQPRQQDRAGEEQQSSGDADDFDHGVAVSGRSVLFRRGTPNPAAAGAEEISRPEAPLVLANEPGGDATLRLQADVDL
ncbi:hypothetical protein GCM10007884_46830 [Methylobacterium brachythecii]|uniref:Uncharacterized protein n=1 Tax=Methylobacterium brachythecii TaxID=1176177 RepID=A0ABQ6D8S5_9HYPH|nr:hypothetical protein GCM10007884_46830 [Methylobacterium brachythecii]